MINVKILLSKDSIKTLRRIYLPDRMNQMSAFLEAMSEVLIDDDDIIKLESLIDNIEFKDYLKLSLNYSLLRFSPTIRKIGLILSTTPNLDNVINIVTVLSSAKYVNSMRLYFKAPPDIATYEIFEDHVFLLAAQNSYCTETYLSASDNYSLIDINYQFREDCSNVYKYIIKNLPAFVLQIREFNEFINFIALLIYPTMKSFFMFYEAESKQDMNVFNKKMNILFAQIAAIKSDSRDMFIKAYECVCRNVLKNFNNYTVKKSLFFDIAGVMLKIPQKDLLLDFIEYTKTYPFEKESPSLPLWEALFDCPAKKTQEYITFFNSPGFHAFYSSYRFDKEILAFLLKHVVIVLREMSIEGFPKSLLPVVLSILMQEKINKIFLARRVTFAKWLTGITNSEMVKSVFVKIFFYEYIFLYQKKFDGTTNIKLTRYCDQFHYDFCEELESAYSFPANINKNEQEKIFLKLFKKARSIIWKPVFERFPQNNIEILEIQSYAESYSMDDLILSEIEKVESQYFMKYYVFLKSRILSKPDDIAAVYEAALHDFWPRLYFDKAVFGIVNCLLPVIGNYPVHPDKVNNLACTDGEQIFLPEYIAHFPDDPDNLDENRNMSMYAALALHEAGHIIGGTFKINYIEIIKKSEDPEIFKDIHNVLEDFRIESYLKKIKAHPQIDDLLFQMNLFLSGDTEKPVIAEFLLYLFDSAGGYFDIITKISDRRQKRIEQIFEMNFNSGRFRSLKLLAEYMIERLRNINIINPIQTFNLSEELYNIIRLWPNGIKNDYIEYLYGRSDIRGDYFSLNPMSIGSTPKPLSREELNNLYDAIDKDPEKFLSDFNLPVFPEMLGDKCSAEIGKDNQVTNMLYTNIDYEAEGVFDYSRRTKADDLSGKNQSDNAIKNTLKEYFANITGGKKKKSTKKKKRIISLNSKTNTRSIVSKCKIYKINTINRKFIIENKKFSYISKIIYNTLNQIIESNSSDAIENSSIDGEIDIERLIEVLIDRNNCENMDFLENIIEKRKSLEVIIGMDISGSTFVQSSESGLTILDIEKHFALIFADALKLLTDKINVYGFNSLTATNIYHAKPIEALSSFSSDNANRDGDFIRYINYILSNSKEELKYFFMISDGQPSSINYEGKYALDDTLLAMKESKKQNIKLIYFNIDSELREYFSFFKNEAHYAEYFSNPLEIVSKIPDLVAQLAREVY